jgi:tRNA(Ile)-lysidine synthase
MNDVAGAIASVPGGAWAVGVSGGADSVALLALLRERGDLWLCVAHLDHETRGGASGEDARFVEELAGRWGIPMITRKRSAIEAQMKQLPSNRSARFRAARMEMFRQVVSSEQLSGVILAHHWDDQAETVMQRLIRGSGPAGLRGMKPCANIGGVTVLRPMLGVRRAALRAVLLERTIAWREDASNERLDQQRNCVRKVLESVALGAACDAWESWLESAAPALPEAFEVEMLRAIPPAVALHAARRWLAKRAAKREEIPADAARRLVAMACDAATPARQDFHGGVHVRRRAGRIWAER